MIKPDMIPKECFVAYQRAFKRGGGVGDAIAAALNAWPKVVDTHPNNIGHLVLQFKESD